MAFDTPRSTEPAAEPPTRSTPESRALNDLQTIIRERAGLELRTSGPWPRKGGRHVVKVWRAARGGPVLEVGTATQAGQRIYLAGGQIVGAIGGDPAELVTRLWIEASPRSGES